MGRGKMRIKRDTNTLRQVSMEHLSYEFEMFNAWDSMIADHMVQKHIPVRNAVIESVAVHTRILLEFFFHVAPRDHDVVAVDFFSDPVEWENWRKDTAENDGVAAIIAAIENRVNKEVVHLTYDRLRVQRDEKAWQKTLSQAHAILKKAYLHFMLTVPADNLAGRILAEKEHVLNQHSHNKK